ncbi:MULTISPECIES: LemA family protein [Bartonella]|uniref:LemA family protein n=1 Tax=Bartonella TaxID=773 RepID=UPI0018DD83AD|nr:MULTISPECIES: LemA family protein [Bartonella]MBH9994440.1 LemA family protein [Bartonella sp. P0291]MBH9997215.1 LemA family protein [Bartonella sp. M0192]MBH9999375.1 LemA family protein [Bartonella sp. M0191]MBI0007143.1 LemA family protein [Bartonella sp. M0193]MBI0010666.1 LemA family protein [Bartonella sp. M0176]
MQAVYLKNDSHSLKLPFIFLLFSLLLPVLSGCGFNTIPTNEEKAHAAWSEVLNQYQRRSDLIPNLVETVKGYAQHEQAVLTGVVEARAKATQTNINADMLNNPEAMQQFINNQSNLTGALSRLMAVAENYPDLKANQNFLALQSQLEGTENRIAVARRDYIEAVRIYNTALKTMPTMIWTWLWYRDAKPMPTFSIDEAAEKAPKVEFNK